MKKPKRTNLLKKPVFRLTKEQIKFLDKEHHDYVNGIGKSYTREESMQIIRGERGY